jgi:uncharacterized protein YdaU (DUF1376 family)
MTYEQKGFYHDMLDRCWIYGSIPSDAAKLARLLGKDCRTCARLLGEVSENFLKVDETFINERIEQERKKMSDKAEKARNSVLKRWLKNDTDVLRTKYQPEPEPESDKDKALKDVVQPHAKREAGQTHAEIAISVLKDNQTKFAALYPLVDFTNAEIAFKRWADARPSRVNKIKDWNKFWHGWLKKDNECNSLKSNRRNKDIDITKIDWDKEQDIVKY